MKLLVWICLVGAMALSQVSASESNANRLGSKRQPAPYPFDLTGDSDDDLYKTPIAILTVPLPPWIHSHHKKPRRGGRHGRRKHRRMRKNRRKQEKKAEALGYGLSPRIELFEVGGGPKYVGELDIGESSPLEIELMPSPSHLKEYWIFGPEDPNYRLMLP